MTPVQLKKYLGVFKDAKVSKGTLKITKKNGAISTIDFEFIPEKVEIASEKLEKLIDNSDNEEVDDNDLYYSA